MPGGEGAATDVGASADGASADGDEPEPEDEGLDVPPYPGESRVAQLGNALLGRSAEIAVAIADAWSNKYGPDHTSFEGELRSEIVKVTQIGNLAVGHYLVTGHSPSNEQAAAMSQSGRAPVDRRLGLASLTKLYLSWRDHASAAVREEGVALDLPRNVIGFALEVIRQGADSSMVGMAKQFDVAFGELQEQLAEERARLAHLAVHDSLTGLPNRVLFIEQLQRALAPSGRRRARIALLFVDIDHFKNVNDRYGHSVGDRLLVTMAERLRDSVRPGDTAARLGGDEFVVLCEDIRGHEEEAVAVAERIRVSLGEPIEIDGNTIVAGASIGVAVASSGDDPEVVLSHADGAMYAAKQNGRGRYALYRQAP